MNMQEQQIFNTRLNVENYQGEKEDKYDKDNDSLARHMPEEIKIDFVNTKRDIKAYIRFLHLVLDYVMYYGKMDEWDFVNRFKDDFVGVLNEER